MAIQYPNLPKLNAADVGGLGGFDLGGAIRSGLQNANLFQEARFKPRNLENMAYAQELANKINEAKAKYAMEKELAGLQNTQASTVHMGAQTALSQGQLGLLPIEKQVKLARLQQLQQSLQQDQQLQNLLSGKKAETNIPAYQQNLQNGQEQVLVAGNPRLQHLNDIYENNPQYRKKLEAAGYKKSQTVKFDPRTGTTSVITQYPNGEVRANTIINTNTENNPATIATKTAAQKTITAIQNARPIIDKIIKETEKGEVPGQWIGKYFKPDTQAAYESDVIQSSDTLAGALGFPGTNEGLHQAQQTVLRKPRESDNGYANRLKTLLKDMDKREETAQNNLNKGVPLTHNLITKEQALAELERRRKLRSK